MARRIFNRYDRYIDRIQKAFDILDSVELEMDTEITQLSLVDKELSDYMHIIESGEPIKNPKAFLEKIRNARKRRREIKIITAVLHKYRQLSARMTNEGNRKLLIADLHKEVKQQQKEYNYRVIDKEDIS